MVAPRVPLYRQAQQELKAFIQTNNLGPGDLLPPEGQLAERLGMSRVTLREGMKSLESLGIVEARSGEGVFVREFSFDPILDNLPYGLFVYGKSLRDLFQVRQGLEIGLVGQILESVRAEHLDALDAIAREMGARGAEREAVVDADRRFHLQLFAPLENPLLLRVIELFWEAYHRLRQEVHPEPPNARRLHRIHAGVVAALRSRDIERAHAAMAHHFEQIPHGMPDTGGAVGNAPAVTAAAPAGRSRRSAGAVRSPGPTQLPAQTTRAAQTNRPTRTSAKSQQQ